MLQAQYSQNKEKESIVIEEIESLESPNRSFENLKMSMAIERDK